MEHRKTPPVLRRTQPELIADNERWRRSRRVRLGATLLGGGVLIGTAAIVVSWAEGAVAPHTAVSMAVALGAAVSGLWVLRSERID